MKEPYEFPIKPQPQTSCLGDVSGTTSSVSELITTLNETLLANKAVGTYKHLENLCIQKLEILINSIEA